MGILESYRNNLGQYAPGMAGPLALFGLNAMGIRLTQPLAIAMGAAAGYVVSGEIDSYRGAIHGGGAVFLLTQTLA